MKKENNSRQLLVSVVIATYNYAQYLPYAIESVLKQTYDNFELIIVDDGSTDNTKEVVAPYLSNEKVKYHYKENAGQASAKNTGIKLARGEYIAFLDADDIWLPEKLELQMKLFKDNPSLGVVYSHRSVIDKDGNEIYWELPKLYSGNVLYQVFISNYFICFSSAVVRKECFKHVGRFDESIALAIDYDLWLRIARYYDFDYVDKPLVKYRRGHSSLSKKQQLRWQCSALVAKRFLDSCKGQAKIPLSVVWRSKAARLATHGWYYIEEEHNRLKALGCFLGSLFYNPLQLFSIKGAIKCFLPYSIIEFMRKTDKDSASRQ